MTIVSYPNRVYGKTVPAIDREMAKRSPQIVRGRQDISGATSLNATISANSEWQIDSIGFQFSNATARD